MLAAVADLDAPVDVTLDAKVAVMDVLEHVIVDVLGIV